MNRPSAAAASGRARGRSGCSHRHRGGDDRLGDRRRAGDRRLASDRRRAGAGRRDSPTLVGVGGGSRKETEGKHDIEETGDGAGEHLESVQRCVDEVSREGKGLSRAEGLPALLPRFYTCSAVNFFYSNRTSCTGTMHRSCFR